MDKFGSGGAAEAPAAAATLRPSVHPQQGSDSARSAAAAAAAGRW